MVSQEDRDQTVTEKNEALLSNGVHIDNNIVNPLSPNSVQDQSSPYNYPYTVKR